MAQFEWFTRRIDLRPGWALADLGGVPQDPSLTLSIVHEYIHFLQLVSSVPGIHLLGDLVSFAVKGALTLTGTPAKGGRIVGSFKILEMLKGLPNNAGQGHPAIAARAAVTRDEADVLLAPQRFPYLGTKAVWDVDVQHVAYGVYAENLHGIVVPADVRGLGFRPLSPGMLSEVMARQIDRWVNTNEGYGHHWGGAGTPTETEHYQGLLHVLSQPRFHHSVDGDNIERVAIIISHLALATPEQDRSAHLMLDELTRRTWASATVSDIAEGMRRLLLGHGLFGASACNEAMNALMHEDAQVMNRAEFFDVYEHMQRIHMAANLILAAPDYYADDTVDWPRVRAWMSRRGLPPIVANDGVAKSLAGVLCEETVTPLLMEVQRVLL